MQEVFNKDIRFFILLFLSDQADYTLNDEMLQSGLTAIGHSLSTDKVRTEILWLNEQGLVTYDTVGNYFAVTATRKGVECYRGLVRVAGVRRPGPGEVRDE